MISLTLSVWFLRAVLLLSFTTGSTGFPISVKQYPKKIQTVPGGNVAFVCEFNHQKNYPNTPHVSWHRRKSNSSLGTERIVESSNIHFYGNTSKGYSILVLEDLQLHDRAMYFCEVLVIFPPPERAWGNGTLLEIDGHQNQTEQLVPTKDSAKDSTCWWDISVISAVSGGCTLALMALLILLAERCRRSKQKSGGLSDNTQEYEDMNMLRRQMISIPCN